MLHVTFSSSGAGSLRQALRRLDQRKQVVEITDDLSWGPIAGGNFVERETWLNENLPLQSTLPVSDNSWNWIASGAEKFQKKLETSDEHLVWLAPQNAGELCGLHWYLDRFGGDNASFILVDHGFPGTWQGQAPKGIGELGPEQFEYLLKNAERTVWDKQRFPRGHWAQLCEEATNLRIVHRGSATSAPDDYFDQVLLAQCSTKWRKLYRVMADAMITQWDAHHDVGDAFWLWRLRELASQRKILASREFRYGASASDDPVLVRLAD